MNKIKKIILYGGLSVLFFVSVVTLTYLLLIKLEVEPLTRTRNVISLVYNLKLPKAYIVQSGSMEPAIKTGSIVISYPSNSYSEGDVVTFSKSVGAKNLITHRIEARFFPDGVDKAPTYLTSGDANEDF